MKKKNQHIDIDTIKYGTGCKTFKHEYPNPKCRACIFNAGGMRAWDIGKQRGMIFGLVMLLLGIFTGIIMVI